MRTLLTTMLSIMGVFASPIEVKIFCVLFILALNYRKIRKFLRKLIYKKTIDKKIKQRKNQNNDTIDGTQI